MNVLILEDESAAARRLEKMLCELRPDARVLETPDSVEDAVHWLQTHPAPDLLLLDIQLADGLSFEIFQHTEVKCPVIFTTAFDEHALQAFKVHAVDYLLKPIKLAELKTALEKTRLPYPAGDWPQRLEALQPRPNYLRRLLVRLGAGMRVVELPEIAYFFSRDKITFLVLKGSGKRYPADYTLEKLEHLLDPEQFYRVNRQAIVSLHAIREMHPCSKSRIKITLEPAADLELIVSAEKAADFKKWLSGGH
jgi:two-component system LytT family response regulator